MKTKKLRRVMRVSKVKLFRARAIGLLMKTGKQMGLSPKLLKDLQALPLVLEHMTRPEWSGMSKAAKLIVSKWGFETGMTMLKTMEMLTTCLRVELGCAEPAYLREQSRALMKTLRVRKVKSTPLPSAEKPEADALGVIAHGLINIRKGLRS